MVNRITIKNFKSVTNLTLDLGRTNIFIGENGSGKTNILEAIAFAAAANANKLDFEFFGSRGIRATRPDFMKSAFTDTESEKFIKIELKFDNENYDCELVNDEKNQRKWINLTRENTFVEIEKFLKNILFEKNDKKTNELISSITKSSEEKEMVTKLVEVINYLPNIESENENRLMSNLIWSTYEKQAINPILSDFIIYSPEESSLRKFEETTQILPLGIKGEGLFQYLKELTLDKKNKKILAAIKDNLTLLDWFEDFRLPKNLMNNEFTLNIKDRYIKPELQYFDQRSTNEGFLYLLFYSTLFVSENTPHFFAIDNIESTFNPKLCTKLMISLNKLAKEHNKQFIATTHNPAILDGLDLSDNEVKLFVISRNTDGHTIARSIEYKPGRSVSLSEAWKMGLIGGLPENF